MADVTSKLTASNLTPGQDTGAFIITKKFAVASGTASNGDNIQLFTVGRACRMVSAHIRNDATLGASCTLQLRKNTGGARTAISAATTAGAASVANSATTGAFDLAAGDIIEALVGGANITASANIEVDLVCDTARAILAGE